ncbi:unnamed protein product [Onchocerca flexuosa]|uniref:RLI domain-containing protein n=1 Tax=Onchocerca flexuosa TaxID=387005 RepID=A0A183HVZ6_9BILA|nr:unnamed protein product [Onchocerca flexuosa]
MIVNHSKHKSGKNIRKVNTLTIVIDDGQNCDNLSTTKMCAKNGVMMRRVKRGKIGQAKLIFLVNGDKKLQYYTLGCSRISPSRQKTGH